MNKHSNRWSHFALLLLAAILVWKCKSAPTSSVKHGGGAYITSAADVNPDANPGPEKAIYAGTVIPIDVKVKPEGQDVTMELWSNQVLLDTEKYESLPAEFDLVNAAGEDYTPPIPILHFPMNVGDSWNWTGQMVTGPASRKSTAVITTTDDKVDMGGSSADALRVDVTISMESGASAPALRTLSFWFVKGKGLVKREFGDSTSRVPAGAATPQ